MGPRPFCMKKYQMFSRRLCPTTKDSQDSTAALISIVSIHYGGERPAVHPPTIGCWISVALDNSVILSPGVILRHTAGWSGNVTTTVCTSTFFLKLIRLTHTFCRGVPHCVVHNKWMSSFWLCVHISIRLRRRTTRSKALLNIYSPHAILRGKNTIKFSTND